jgi:hypothetical protein
MPQIRHLLVFALLNGALACSEKPKAEPTPEAQPDPGSLAKPDPAPSAAPRAVDRSPIPITNSASKLTLTATKLDQELLEERTRMWLDERLLRLHPLRDRMLVSYAGFVAVLEDNNKLELIRHIWPQEAYELTAIFGAWPKAVVARVDFDSWKSPGYQRQAPIKWTRSYRWTGADWDLQDGSDWGAKGAAWRDGTILSFNENRLNVIPAAYFAASENKSKPDAPKQAAPSDPARCKDTPTEVVGEELDALPSGEAFVLGKRCGGGSYAMERWAPDQAESAIDDLPDAPAAAKRGFLSASAPDRLHVVLSTGEKVYAARWEGQAFRKLELNEEGTVRAIWTAADGALFFVLEGKANTPKKGKAELLRVLPSGELSRSAVFAPSPSLRVWAADAQTAFVSSYGSILSTKPGLTFTPGKSDEPKPSRPAPSATALPAFTDGCSTPFVFLYDVSSKSPPGFDFPSTRKALSAFPGLIEIGLIEFEYKAQRKLGVKVSTAGVGRELIEHLKTAMPDEHPDLVCFAPSESVRAIKLP